MSKTSILIVDDDPNILHLLSANLGKRNYAVREATNGRQAIALMKQMTPDLAILDLVMPGISGYDLCLWIRERGLDIPIMVLSAHNDESLKVKALDAGADDYVTKPFKTEEFLARMRALMRRSGPPELSPANAITKIGGLTIDWNGRRAIVEGVDIRLTRTELALLAFMVNHCDAVITHDELLAAVWGEEYRGSHNYLHVYLSRIRKKMGDQYGALLETTAGMGYLFHSRPPTSVGERITTLLSPGK